MHMYPPANNPVVPTNVTTVRKCTCHSALYPRHNEYELGPLQERVSCLNDSVVQGGAQEATMYLQLHCRRKTRGSGNPEAAAIL